MMRIYYGLFGIAIANRSGFDLIASHRQNPILRRGTSKLFSWLALLFLGLFAFPSIASAQLGDGDFGWRSDSGPSGVWATPREACQAQKDFHNPNAQSRFIGALSTSDANIKSCSWTQFQYLCPEETGFGINGCGTTFPSYVIRRCATGYSYVGGKYCRKDPVPERGCGANENGSRPNPAVGNPIILSTGCKILREEDYATADGLLEVSRNYRSIPIGASVSFRDQPLGLAGNWTFDFAHEIQFSNITGTSAAPDVKLALVASDGTAYDFQMQSGGAIVPNTATGEHYAPKNIKVEHVGPVPANMNDLVTATSQWKMTDEEETVWTFQTFQRTGYVGHIFGRPMSKTTKENYRWDFTYNADGALQTITDSFGRQLVFTWHYFNVSALPGYPYWPEAVQSIALPDGTSIRYTYDPPGNVSAPATAQVERLVKAERLSSTGSVLRSTGYSYDDPRFHWHITSVKRTDGQTIASYSYDSSGNGQATALAGNVNPFTIASSESATEIVRTVTTPLGRVEQYRFERIAGPTQYRLSQIDGQATSTVAASTRDIAYGANSFMSAQTDEEGRTTNFGRDARGNAISTVEAVALAEQRTTGVAIHPTLNLPTQEVRPGLTIAYTYDPQGKMLTRTESDTTAHSIPYSTNGQTRTWTYGWATNGRLLSINGPLPATGGADDTLTFTYSPQGNLLTSTNGLGHVTTFAGHDANGRPATMTDPNNIVTAFTYDALGRTTAINVKHPTSAAEDAITALEYDNEGRVIGITAPATDKLIIDYNLAGQVTAIRAASGERIDYTYNAAGGVTAQTVKRSNGTTAQSITRTFDSLNRLLTETLGPNRTTTWEYDKVGNPKKRITARNNATHMAFDGLDRLVSTAHPGGGTETLTYTPLDDMAGFTDAVSVQTSYVRNGFGDVIQEISPDRGTSTYTYNAAGQLVSMTDGRGQVLNYTRDILGRTLTVTPVGRPASEKITYSYDTGGIGSYQTGRLTKVVDGSGTTSFQYDHRGNMLVKQQAIGASNTANLTFAYNRADRITQITYPSGRIVDYVRDTKQRVTTVRTKASAAETSWTTLATAMDYEPFASLTKANLGNGLAMTANWGNDGRLAFRRLKNAAGKNVSLLSYAYDNDDNITAITDGVTAANSLTYAYDSRGRLSMVEQLGGGQIVYNRQDYLYDANGNRTAHERRFTKGQVAPDQTETYTRTPGTNRLASISGDSAPRTLSYDARGNLASETRPGGITVTTGYDGHGRLTSYARSGETSLVHVYNGVGDRVATTTTPNGGTADTRRYLTAPDGRTMGEYGASATDVRAEFIWLSPEVGDSGVFGGDDGLGGYMPIAVATTGGTLTWVHADHMGVPTVYTNASGTAITGPSGYSVPAYPGQSRTLTDLYYNRHRDYDPTTGRYIQADPIGLAGGASPYSYAMNNPVRYMDPTGEIIPAICLTPIGAVGCGAAAGAATEVVLQLTDNWLNDRPLGCIEWGEVFVSGGLGAFGGNWANGLVKLTKGSMKWENASRRIRRAEDMVNGPDDLHHWLVPRRWGDGRGGPRDWLINRPWNLNPIERQAHRGLHGTPYWQHIWNGAPLPVRGAVGLGGIGAVGEIADGGWE